MGIKKTVNFCVMSLLALILWLAVPVGSFEAEETKGDDALGLIKEIGDKASEVAKKNDLYASVMIAQAILASDFGRGELCQPSVNNLFSIKGRFQDEFVKWSDNRIDDSAEVFTEYRKYPSYEESLNDYVALLKNGIATAPDFYAGAWRSKTINYRSSTAFLTSRYAEDLQYALNLNVIIELYNLTDFDAAEKVFKAESVKKNAMFEKLIRHDRYIVKANETITDIARDHNISVAHLMETNQLSQSGIIVGQELIVD
ncbi:glucosaminidase domain-containing protein [Vagococcus sp. BWB3-3]|uniref:Peptidoglycan hydrolase n=1 Tax=Vagococcus allomyrinae TaxID=2794353 RepID=A0A940PFZ4_9ENTE|nr:glucosaminidase domain-containing protein [Vagococcus allomyrinae]